MKLIPDKNILNDIIVIAGPVVGGVLTQMLLSLIDTAMVGRLGNSKEALAALGLAFLASWTVTSFFSSISTGTHVLVARRHGEGDIKGTIDVLNNSLASAIILGLLLGGIGYFFSYEIIDFFTKDSLVAKEGAGYMAYRFLGLPFFLMVVTYRGFFYGIGHTKIFLWSAIIIMVFHIVGNILFIYGSFGFPRMGLNGAGFSSFLSMIIGCIFFVSVTFLKQYRITYESYRKFRLSKNIIYQVFKISMPVSIQNVMILLGFLIFISITGLIGTAEQAASQLVTSALFISFIPCFSLGIAAQTLVGQSLGRNNPRRALIYGFESAKIGTFVSLLIGTLFLSFPNLLLCLITNNDELINIATPLLRIAGAAQIFYSGGIILANSLQAAGATFYVMVVEVVTHWIIFLPLTYLLGVVLNGGIIWAWLTLPVYVLMFLLLNYIKFYSRSWMQIKI